jgi:hypothetical protein
MPQLINLRQQIGSMPAESKAKARMRFHQGWWRTFVLNEPEGPHPKFPAQCVCSALVDGESTGKNLIGDGTRAAIDRTLSERAKLPRPAGLIDQRRLFNNMLSSQPLAFNFFGKLQQDLGLATQLMHRLIPGIDEVVDVRFEFAPQDWIDNSAFDVALVVRSGGRTGIVGFESKFTETFSQTEYDNEKYEAIAAASGAFPAPYRTYIAARFNQLFRNQLMAEELVLRGEYAFRMTGLFCYQDDEAAIATGRAFQAALGDPSSFHVITYARFLEELQQLPLPWPEREWSMMLWARYCALELSEAASRSAG